MKLFKHRSQALYLVTNLKVMYSTLATQRDIVEVPKSVALLSEVGLRSLGVGRSRFFLLVRNPYDRLASFFRNKFRSTLPRIVASGEWQYCHEIFFPALGLSATAAPSAVAERLSRTSFAEFIAVLPSAYTQDGHVYPQHWAERFPVWAKDAPVGVPIRYDAVFRMESDDHLRRMAALFDLDLRVRENDTTAMPEAVGWTAEAYATVNKLFREDFVRFAYPMRDTPTARSNDG